MQFVKASERLPENGKPVFAKDDKGIKYSAFYSRQYQTPVQDFEDNGDFEVYNDDLYLKEGWYEETEQASGGYDILYYSRNIIEWLDEGLAKDGKGDKLKQLFIELTTWQKETFPQANAFSKACHLREEVEELISDLENDKPEQRLEFADCFLLLFGSANAAGMSYEDCCDAITEKLAICRTRKWGKPDSNGVVKHIPQPPQQ